MPAQLTILALILLTSGDFVERFPYDDVVVLEHETRITILPDAKAMVWERVVSMPLTLEGREDFSDVRIPFFAPLQRIHILSCKTTSSDGAVIEAEPHAFNPVTPDGYGKAPDFVGFRELVVSPPGVEEETEIELVYVVEDSAASFPWWEMEVAVGQIHPVLQRTVRVENRSGASLSWQLLNLEGGKPGQDSTAIWWVFKDLPAYPTRGAGPRASTVVPRLLLTTCPSWEALSAWSHSTLCQDSLLPDEFMDSLSTSIADAVSRLDSLEAVLDVVDDFVDEVPAPDRRFWICRPYARLMETGHAEPWEHSALVALLARRAGFAATVCLLGPPVSKETLPLIELLPDPVVLITGQEPLWLTENGVRKWPERHGPFSFLPLIPREAEPVLDPGIGPCTGHVVVRARAEGEDSLVFRGEIRLSAALIPAGARGGAPEKWLKKRIASALEDPDDLEFQVQGLWRGGAVYAFNGGLRLKDTFEIHGELEKLFGSAWVPPRATVFRAPARVPVLVPLPVDLTCDLRLKKADSWSVLCPEEGSVRETEIGSFEVRIEAGEGERRIVRHLRLLSGWFDEDGMHQVRELLSLEGQRATKSVMIVR